MNGGQRKMIKRTHGKNDWNLGVLESSSRKHKEALPKSIRLGHMDEMEVKH
jgi:hypothetical protein